MSQQIVSCPYNPLHRIARSKLRFHEMRCKDRQKREHLYSKCRYNSLHVFLKEEIQTHEFVCPDRSTQVRLLEDLRSSERRYVRPNRQKSEASSSSSSSSSSRSRSRFKGKKEEPKEEEDEDVPRRGNQLLRHRHKPNVKKQRLNSSSDQSQEDLQTLQDCQQCQKLMKLFLSTKPAENDKLLQLINKYKGL